MIRLGISRVKFIWLLTLGVVFSTILVGVAVSSVNAQDGYKADASSKNDPITVEAFLSRLQAAPDDDIYALVRMSIDEEWHVNSHVPIQDYLIPTTVQVEDSLLFKPITISYPPGKKVIFAFSPDEPLSVYSKTVEYWMRLKIDREAAAGVFDLNIDVTAQACNDRMCLAPLTEVLTIPIKIDPSYSGGETRFSELFNSMPGAAGELSEGKSENGEGEETFWLMLRNFDATAFVGKYGYILAYIAMYILGLGLTLTPCVYPIIPITIGFFGTQAGGRWSRQLLTATVFGVGIAISYATVGTAAAFTGSLMGAALQSMWVLIGLAALCVAMGFNAFGVFEIRLPGWLTVLTSSGSRRGLIGAAVMGLTMGVASAPCLAAFIISLLAFIGQKGDPVLGFTMFLVLGLGLATPFIALGTFSGMINKIPKSGGWMVYAKKLMGSLLFAAALYFLNTVIPDRYFYSLVLVSLVAAGLYFGYFETTPAKSIFFRVFRGIVGIAFIGAAFWWGLPSAETISHSGIDWQPYSPEAVEQAKSMGRPVVIDVFADWCIPCKELDKSSFSDPRVISKARQFAMFKADLTRGNSPESKEVRRLYDIKGVPTVIFINADGHELQDLRVVQFEPADEILMRFEELSSTVSDTAPGPSSGP